MSKSIVGEKNFRFAIRIVNLYRILSKDRNEYVLSKQILRPGTSFGANIRETLNEESNADFIHKLGISQKESNIINSMNSKI